MVVSTGIYATTGYILIWKEGVGPIKRSGSGVLLLTCHQRISVPPRLSPPTPFQSRKLSEIFRCHLDLKSFQPFKHKLKSGIDIGGDTPFQHTQTIKNLPRLGKERWPQKSEHCSKWISTRNSGMLMSEQTGAYHEQKTPQKSLTSL